MLIGHRENMQKLTFRALALRRSETSALESLRWPIHIINAVDKTKLSLTNLADWSPIREYCPSVDFSRVSLLSVRATTTSGRADFALG